MFSGIIEDLGHVVSVDAGGGVPRLRVRTALETAPIAIGESIAVNGVCLTVVASHSSELSFELLDETRRRSTLGRLRTGDRVNLERSLRVGDRISGHFVFGHVDETAPLLSREPDGACERLRFMLPAALAWGIVSKGSVALAGVSLTVGEVGRDAFSVYIIPHTAQATTLGALAVGELINVEIDMLARYARSALRSEGVA